METAAKEIIQKLQDLGYIAVIAGGWVRDNYLGIYNNDIDIATNATPDEINEIFDNVKLVGKDFGVSIVVHRNYQFEVATFRKDGTYSDSRHPDSVEFCDLEEDAKRRDFTINALFYDPINEQLLDSVNGLADINNKVIRFVGNASNRIQEDNIRILRAIRFTNRLAFSLNEDTRHAIEENSHLLGNVAKERLGLEFNKILMQCDSSVFDLLYYLGVLDHTIPELIAMRGCEQPPEFHPEGDVWTHTLLAFDYMKTLNPSIECLWAVLLHDIGKPAVAFYDEPNSRWRFNNHDNESVKIARDILSRLKFSCSLQDRVCDLIANHMRFAYVQKMKKSKLKRFIYTPYFEDHCKLHKADCMGSHGEAGNIEFCERKLEEFSKNGEGKVLPKPIVTGKTLISMGLIPGKKFKEILEYAMDGQLENKFDSEESGIEYVKKNLL